MCSSELSQSFSNEGDINLVFFGSISLVMEPGCKAIIEALEKMDGNPAFFLDPNVRPSMISDPESYRRMVFTLAGKSDLVRVSDEIWTLMMLPKSSGAHARVP